MIEMPLYESVDSTGLPFLCIGIMYFGLKDSGSTPLLNIAAHSFVMNDIRICLAFLMCSAAMQCISAALLLFRDEIA